MVHSDKNNMRAISQGSRKKYTQLLFFIISFILFFLLFSQLFKAISSPIGWDSIVNISSKDLKVYSYHVSSSNSLVVIAVYGELQGVEGIYTLNSLDGGMKFFKAKRIAKIERRDSGQVINPRIAISGTGEITVVWQNFSDDDDPSYAIYLARSQDQGLSWSSAQKLELGTEMTMLPHGFYDDRSIFHLFYHGLKGPEFAIYHVAEDKTQFLNRNKISLEGAIVRGAFFPAIIAHKKNIYVVWQGKDNSKRLSDDLYFTSSQDYGNEWSNSRRITFSDANDNAPTMTIIKDSLFLSYLNNEDTNWKVNLLRGLNQGAIWEEKPLVAHKTNLDCFSPYIYENTGSNAELLWYQKSEQGSVILSTIFNVDDGRFNKAGTLSDEGEQHSEHPSIFKYKSRITAIWLENGALRGKKSDTYTAPPKVDSSSHPKGQWSQFENAELSWTPAPDASGIEGYAVIVNQEPYFDPTVVNIEVTSSSTITATLPDGVSYFHIRTVDRAGNYSRTIHYPLLVSKSPLSAPKIVSSTHQDGEGSEKRDVQFSWNIDDEIRIKGFYYSLTPNRISKPQKFIKDRSLDLKNLKKGRYFLTLRAVDKVGKAGRIATFELVIGEKKKLTPKEYERIAQGLDEKNTPINTTGEDSAVDYDFEDKTFSYENQEIIVRALNKEHSQDSIRKFIIEFKHPDSDLFRGTEFFFTIYQNDIIVKQGVNLDGKIKLDLITDGEYKIVAEASYMYLVDPQSVVRKTAKSSLNFDYKTITKQVYDPIDEFFVSLSKLFVHDWKINSLLLLTLISSLISSMTFFKLYYVSRASLSRILRRIILIFQTH